MQKHPANVADVCAPRMHIHFFFIYSNGKFSLNEGTSTVTNRLHEMRPPSHCKMPRNQIEHTYPLQILWFCGWAQQLTWLTLQSSREAALALALPSFCPPNNYMQSSKSYRFTCCFTHTVQLLHKHSFITFHLTHSNIICRKRMFSKNNMSASSFFSFGISRKLRL